VFLAGFLAGVVVLYVLLLFKGQLVRGPSFASAPTSASPVTPVSPSAPSLPTSPVPAPSGA